MRTQYICLVLAIIVLCPHAFAQWVKQESGTTENLYGVHFTDANTGTVVGDSGIILRTTDGGLTWTNQQVTAQALRGVSFTDAIRGTVVGDSGTILRTTNGGVTWTNQSSGTSAHLRGVSFVDANIGTVVGGGYWEGGTDSCMILHTTNGGVTWVHQSGGTVNDLLGVSFTDVSRGTAVGINGAIIRTTDGGASWTSQTTSMSDVWKGVCFLNSHTEIVVGTMHGGGMSEGNPFVGIYRTSDNGASWTKWGFDIGRGEVGFLNAISFADTNIGTAVGGYTFDVGRILRTTDGGSTWACRFEGNRTLHSVCFTDVDTGTAVGDSGTILRTTNGGVTWVEGKQQTSVPQWYLLSQNYPNPFNPSTTIKYELPKASMVRLSVYDMLGREVSGLVNERRDAGVHEVQFDGANLASGVYFYRLQAGDYVTTKKLLLMK